MQGSQRSALEHDRWGTPPHNSDDLFVEINITPLTDIILVMLIIFMVGSSVAVDAAREGRLEVSLPEVGASEAKHENSALLVVSVTQKGALIVEGQERSPEQLNELLRDVHQKSPETAIILDADGGLSHQSVVAVIERVRAAGFATVHLGATER